LLDVNAEGEPFVGGALVARGRLVPSARVTPTLSFGLGALSVSAVESGPFIYGTATAGIEGRLSRSFGVFVEGGVDYPFTEGLDGLQGSGTVNDNVWVGRGGIVVYAPF
ncbi:hypothetical protein, partial [Rubrivirga sp.]|uniref:hypothetical protein n=1 Tax=Rubrivirga sp. TaxID=1885344 RepID=UPI003C71A447